MDLFKVSETHPVPVDESGTLPVESAGSQTAPDQAPDTQPPAEAEAGAEQAEAPKPRPIQKRIGELVRERETERRARAQAEQEAAYWRQQAESLKQAPAAPKEIRSEDFPTYEDYLIAKARTEATATLRQELAQQAETQQRMAEQRAQESVLSDFQARAEDARARYEDFDEVVFDNTTPITPHMAHAIVTAEAGHEVAYYLGRNKKEAARIASLHPVAQAVEIGRLEARITSQPRRVTQAPPPPSTVVGSALPARDPANASSFAEYKALRMAREREAGKRR